MKRVYEKFAFYLFLIPLFFVLHGSVENFGLIGIRDCLFLVFVYVAATIFLYFIFSLLLKNHRKTALITSYSIGFYLFFGAIYDFFKNNNTTLYNYIISISLFFILLITGLIYLKRAKKKFARITLFLNLLLTIFTLTDLAILTGNLLHNSNNIHSKNISVNKSAYQPCTNCPKPDIYLLLFDEYASSISLKERFNYNNSGFDSFLLSRKFHIITNSTSNYDFTPFSMASILNMSYLPDLNNPKSLTAKEYAGCDALIQNNEIVKYLSAQGYDFINYSVFDISDKYSAIEQTLLPIKTKLITSRTLWGYLQKDMNWVLYAIKVKLKKIAEHVIFKQAEDNENIILLTEKESMSLSGKPKFVYAHLYMPHPPYFFDKEEKKRDIKTVTEENNESSYQSYLNYLSYTNRKAKELIDTILSNTNKSAVIIFLSDHGFRHITNIADRNNFFQNQNAIYFPDQDYISLNDSLSAVNEFRVVFNKLFNAQFPLLRDSVIFLENKPKN
ncbi:MAG TPA: sulfatase-like hydrolase/transferase [Puia sp.]|nr:sulfatase-like hydrolase/transferase [Puia sp.]